MFRVLVFINCLFFLACSNETNSSNTGGENIVQKTQTTTGKPIVELKKKNIVFFGDSLSAGYGLEPSQAFPALIQNKIEAANLDYKVVNAGISGDTTTGGANRINWILKQQKVDIFVLELGGNDALRGVDPKLTYQNMKTIIEALKATYPEAKVLVAGMEAPPNLGNEYTKAFRALFSKIATEYEAAFIPFLLDKVGGVPELNQADEIHPTAEGHQIVADNVWAVLQSLL